MAAPQITAPRAQKGLKRQLGLWSMTLAVVTGTIGSGWLFAPYLCAKAAGPFSMLAWLLGGLMSFVIAIVFAELGAVVTTSGALAAIPLLTHGRTSGFIGGEYALHRSDTESALAPWHRMTL